MSGAKQYRRKIPQRHRFIFVMSPELWLKETEGPFGTLLFDALGQEALHVAGVELAGLKLLVGKDLFVQRN